MTDGVTRLFWVRHGPTHASTMVGWSDLPADLSDTARLARLEAFLPREALLISSDLVRASATADAIEGPRTRLPHDAGLREIHFGAWELKTFDAVDDPDRLRAFWDDPGDVRPSGGESWHEVSARVTAATDRLVAAYPGRDIILTAHFGAILTQVQRALGITAYQAFAHRIDNLSVTELHLTDGTLTAARINHLP